MKAFITGITGQDGSYLADLLLEKGYEVVGGVRRSATKNHWRINHIEDQLYLVDIDLSDISSLENVFEKHPDITEVYNLAAQSFVGSSWDTPIYTSEVTGLGALNVLEAIRKKIPKAKFYQASSSEMFGKVQDTPQNELTKFYPRSPYGVAKCFAHYMTVNYRESYNMFACSGILFNHESERRGIEFVTRKITDGVARIKLGLADELLLGNLDAERDWGHAKDYVRAMWLMLQQDKPEDFVISTGKKHSVRKFCEVAFQVVGLKYFNFIDTDDRFVRPAEVDYLIGDSSKAFHKLNWHPTINFEELVKKMVLADIERLK